MDEHSVRETEYEELFDVPDPPNQNVAPLNTAKVIKGEIHNVLNVMRADSRYASPLRFSEELPVDEHLLLRSLKELHEKLGLWESAQEPMDVVAYLTPFCSAISERDISASVTGAALSSLHKFLLYGFVTQDTTPHATEGMTLIAKSLLHCTFEESGGSQRRLNTSTHSGGSSGEGGAITWDDEQVVLKLLNLSALVVRCSLQDQQQPLLDASQVVGLLGTCLHVSHRAKQASPLLKSAAADALGQIVLVVFHETPLPQARCQVLSQLASLTNPQQYSDATCVTSLTLLNIALETMQQAPTQAEIAILQNDLCKHLLQLSTTHDLVILALTLRVIFNLFQTIRNHLKVPLEVFLTSVHLRILDLSHDDVSNEQREVALESLLEFCQEPALMQDLYLNYDCDVHCSNLFELICATLAKVASPKSDSLNALNRLALEGILHVMDSIARRCHVKRVHNKSEQEEDTESETNSENLELGLEHDSLGDRWKAEEILQERKQHKFLLTKVATEFNQNNPDWIQVAQDLQLFSDSPSAEQVAKFLYTTPHLDKTQVGIYLSKGPSDQYPFHAQVRSAFCALFDFRESSFSQALRKFLSRFRLPGEAQCIDRLMEAFANELYQQQAQQQQNEVMELESSEASVFRNADAVFTLAFSTIILNTDLHNPTIRDERRMTLEQFLRNNRGINGGEDFPQEFMTELYTEIKEQEIQVRRELLELIRRKIMSGDEDGGEIHAKHWAGILSKSSEVAQPFFTPIEAARRNDIQAGIHDRAMFVSISKSALECISTVFVRSTDDALVVKALHGFTQMAKICTYFDLDETFNEILQTLLGQGRDYIMSCIAMEYAGYDSQQIMAAGPSSPTTSPTKQVEEEPATAAADSLAPVPAILMTSSEDDQEVSSDIHGSAAHRGLLALDAGFTLVSDQPSRIREAWPTLIECLCALRDARALPDRVIFLDDFADSRGNLLPLSPFAKQSQKRLDEYYKSLSSDKEEDKQSSWFQFSSLFHATDDTKSRFSDKTAPTQDETDSLSEKELSSFSRSLLAITKRARLEEVVLMRPTNSAMATQTIRALLDAIDAYPYYDDPVFEQHAVYSLELALLALISNKDKVQQLYPLFLPKFETVLRETDEQTANSQASVHLPTPFLMERVVVTILRSCIHLYDYPEVRPDLRKPLQLLLLLPPNFMRCIADRMSCGMAIFVSQKFPLFDSDEEWAFVGDMLDRLAHFGAGRGFVFDGIANAVESQLAPSSQKGDSKVELSYGGSLVLSRLLVRFIFGSYENDMSLVVPAMMCLENLYRHMVIMKRAADSDDDEEEEEEGSIDPNAPVDHVPDKELWQNVAVAFYSVCRSMDPNVSSQGSDCFQRFVMSTDVETVPDDKWISILFLIVDKQPPVAAHETRVNTCAILGKVLLMTVGHLSKNKDNWEDLTDIITQTAEVVGENLREGRNGSVSPLFESTLQAVTFLSNHMVSDEFDGDEEYGQWTSETLLAELEKVGALGGSIKNIEATSKRPTETAGATNGNHTKDDTDAKDDTE